MPRPLPKPEGNQRRISAHDGRKNAPSAEAVRECLNYLGIPAKQWGDAMSVGERRIQKWRSGEEVVPEGRRLEVVLRFQDLVADQLIAVQAMVRRALREAYGDTDDGRF